MTFRSAITAAVRGSRRNVEVPIEDSKLDR
jgi:hypothetical protein